MCVSVDRSAILLFRLMSFHLIHFNSHYYVHLIMLYYFQCDNNYFIAQLYRFQ